MASPPREGATTPAVVSNAERYHFADFTRENYRRLIRLAGESYASRTFTDFRPDERYILWRHDVDFSPQAARKLARIEADEGVVATYFLYLHSELYNLLERDSAAAIRDILRLGHRLGLHFDAGFGGPANEQGLAEGLAAEKRVLEEVFGETVPVFSFHMPTPFTATCRGRDYAGMINASATYFQEEVGYCSDSNGIWRHRRLENVLRESKDARLQVLIHPEWWQDEAMSPRERFDRCIAGRADHSRRWYEGVLGAAGRENVDWDPD